MNNLFGHRYPYSNFHEMNLDWVIEEVKTLDTKVNNMFQGAVEEAIDEYFNRVMIDAIYDEATETITLSREIAVEDGLHIYSADENRMIISDGSIPLGGDD